MKDKEIKKYLDDVRLSYRETRNSFIIPKEKNMSDNKAPKWFAEFEKRNNARFDSLENRIDTLESKVDKNAEMILENRNMITTNHKLILKAHPEFKK